MIAERHFLRQELAGEPGRLANDLHDELLTHLLRFLRDENLGVLLQALAPLFGFENEALLVPLALLAKIAPHALELLVDLVELGFVFGEPLLRSLAHALRVLDLAKHRLFAFDERLAKGFVADDHGEGHQRGEVEERREKGRRLARSAPQRARRDVGLLAEKAVPPVDGGRRS